VYLPSREQLPDERWRVGGISQGDFHVVKGVLETLYESLHLELRPRRGTHALLHPGKTAEV
jgi:phenylalanyl-tRNA synthetase beta subunit